MQCVQLDSTQKKWWKIPYHVLMGNLSDNVIVAIIGTACDETTSIALSDSKMEWSELGFCLWYFEIHHEDTSPCISFLRYIENGIDSSRQWANHHISFRFTIQHFWTTANGY